MSSEKQNTGNLLRGEKQNRDDFTGLTHQHIYGKWIPIADGQTERCTCIECGLVKTRDIDKVNSYVNTTEQNIDLINALHSVNHDQNESDFVEQTLQQYGYVDENEEVSHKRR